MRIKTSGQSLVLYRYGGLEGTRSIELKIGSLSIDTAPEVSDASGTEARDGKIPISVWENLTVIEQRKLIAELQQRQNERVRLRLSGLAADLTTLASHVKSGIVGDEEARHLIDATAAFANSMRRAGYRRPLQSAGDPSRIASVDIPLEFENHPGSGA